MVGTVSFNSFDWLSSYSPSNHLIKLTVRFTKLITTLNLYMKSQPIKAFKVRFSSATKSWDIDKWFTHKIKVNLSHIFKKSPPADFEIQWSSGVDLMGMRKLRTNCKDTIDNQDPVSKRAVTDLPFRNIWTLFLPNVPFWSLWSMLRTGFCNCYCVDWVCPQTVLRCSTRLQL